MELYHTVILVNYFIIVFNYTDYKKKLCVIVILELVFNIFFVSAGTNLGNAVATSMNLTNSSEPMAESSAGTHYKLEPSHDMMYYQVILTNFFLVVYLTTQQFFFML